MPKTLRQLPTRSLIPCFAIAALALCACVPKDSPPLVDWPKLVTCADGVADDVVPAVTRVLISAGSGELSFSDASKAELQDLGEKHGYDAVTCAIDQVRRDWDAPGATQSPERLAASARAKDFFLVEEITVLRRGEPGSYLRRSLDPRPKEIFVPTKRDPCSETPWHVVLRSARGQRS